MEVACGVLIIACLSPLFLLGGISLRLLLMAPITFMLLLRHKSLPSLP
jgi:hypothetical protein